MYTNTNDLIHSSGAAVTLTATLSDNLAKIAGRLDDVETIVLEVKYTPKTGQSNRYCELFIEKSSDDSVYTPICAEVDGAGYNAVYNHGLKRGPYDSSGATVTTGGTVYYWETTFPASAKYYRVSIHEDGSANFGTALVKLTTIHRGKS